MKTILITGANGFIGQSMIRNLSGQGYFIRGAYRSTKLEFSESEDAVAEWMRYDLDADDNDYSRLLNDVEVVIHLAAKVHILNKNKCGLETFQRTNVLGTKKLAEESAIRGVKRFIFISTVKVHGEQTILNNVDNVQRFTEDDQLCPVDAYATSKLEAECIISDICQSSGMDYVIFRPPLVYGPYVKANFLRLIDAIAKGMPLPLATIKNLRSLLYVENFCDVILECIKQPRAANNIYLISDIDILLTDLIEGIAHLLGRKALLFPCPKYFLKLAGQLTGRKATVDRLTESLLVDNTKVMRELQWFPPVNFEEGLKSTIDWYQNCTKK